MMYRYADVPPTMAPIANALRLIYRIMSATKQVEKALKFANLYVLVTDITYSVFKNLSLQYGRTLPSY